MRNRAETTPLLSLVPHACTTRQSDIPLFTRRGAASGAGSSSSRAGLSESNPRIRRVVAEMGRSRVLCAGSTNLAQHSPRRSPGQGKSDNKPSPSPLPKSPKASSRPFLFEKKVHLKRLSFSIFFSMLLIDICSITKIMYSFCKVNLKSKSGNFLRAKFEI